MCSLGQSICEQLKPQGKHASVLRSPGAGIPCEDNGTFISSLPLLAVSLPLFFLVGLWFKVTLLGFAWCFPLHATGEVSLSKVDGTQMGQLVIGPAGPQASVFKGFPKPA